MQTKIKDDIIAISTKGEFNPSVRVTDVREYNADFGPCLSVIGGFTVELIMAFAGLYEWTASKEMDDFRFTNEGMEKFIHDLMFNNEFPEGTMVIKLRKDIKKKVLETHGDNPEAATDMCV